jgi:hypothetical protein
MGGQADSAGSEKTIVRQRSVVARSPAIAWSDLLIRAGLADAAGGAGPADEASGTPPEKN